MHPGDRKSSKVIEVLTRYLDADHTRAEATLA
jgi:hypothetical protein